MMFTFRKQVVAVIGATGQVGTPLTKNLLSLGHEVKVVSRKPLSEEKAKAFEGAEVVILKDMLNVQALVEAFKGVQTLICAVPGSPEVIKVSEPIWLEASLKAGVKRFVPTEFGAHTRACDYGDGVIFDQKKDMHKKIFDSGIGWTFFYNGGIMDYLLTNLRFFEKITTFGDVNIPIYVHEIEDIGRVAAMALTDDRTMNKCVQMDFNSMTQAQMVEALKTNFPDYDFEYEHFSSEFILDAVENSSDEVTAKKGAETDKERWGINCTVYVKNKLAAFTDETLRGTELYPEMVMQATPEEKLKDPTFVFE